MSFLFCLSLVLIVTDFMEATGSDWPTGAGSNTATVFACPHRCGEFGSQSIREVEWEFILLMYQADLISSFFKRNSEPYYEITSSIIEPLWTQFSYEKPLDLHSEWVKEMLRYGAENGVGRLTCGDGNIELESDYESIFPLCAQNHHAPSAFYHMTLHHFQSGDHLRALEALRKVFNLINPNSLEVHLASQIALSSGQIKNESGFFDEAILSLQQALDYNPQNKEAYFEKAIAYFEKGEYSQSISDYLASDYKVKPVTPNMVEFSSGLIKGIICGGTKSLANFLPSTLASLYGLGHGIWAFACSPREVSLEMVETCCAISDFLFAHSSLETVQVLVPELKEFSHDLSDHRRGEVIGTIIGKYGVDFFAFAGLVKGMKLYRNLKKANEALTLHSLASFEKGQKIRQVSQRMK